MSVDHDIQEKFARQMQDEYGEKTLLPEFCNRRHYSRHDKKIEYIQLGKRIPIPVDVFKQGVLEPTTKQMARNITTGEENFILNDLINVTNESSIKSQEMNGLNLQAIEEAVKTTERADTVFIPYADGYNTVVNDWLSEGIAVSGGTQLKIGNHKLDVHRIVPSFGIKDVLVTNSRKIDLVQKRAKDTSPPKGLAVDESMEYVNNEQEFMIYFGSDTEPGQPDEQYDEYLDVVFRVVISQPMPCHRSAVRLEAPSGIELSDEPIDQ